MTEREILEMAMAMEEIGKGFYEALAVGSDHPEVRSFCLRASQEKAKHFATMKTLRDLWAATRDGARLDEDDECVRMARKQILPDLETLHRVAVSGNLDEALDLVVQLETDAVHFYLRLLKSLPGSDQAVGAIVAQEKNHLWQLQNLRGQARAA